MIRTCPTCRGRLDRFGWCRKCSEKKWADRAKAAANGGRVPKSREQLDAEIRDALYGHARHTDDLEQQAARSSVAHHLAHHEAGHVVVAREMGLPIVEVRIDLPDGGETRYGSAPLDWSADGDGAVLMAGHLAEVRWCPGDARGSWHDRDAALALLDRDDFDPHMAVRIAEDILDRHAGDVERVADALIRHRHLTGQQVAELLADQQPTAAASTQTMTPFEADLCERLAEAEHVGDYTEATRIKQHLATLRGENPPGRSITDPGEIRALRLRMARKAYEERGEMWDAHTEQQMLAYLGHEERSGVVRDFSWSSTVR